MGTQKTGSEKQRLSTFSRIEKIHPYKTFLFFALLGSTMVFLSLIFLYAMKITRTDAVSFEFPKIFFVSTVILLLSSFSVSRCLYAFKNDKMNDIVKSLVATLALALCFNGTQILGWKSLYDQGFFITSNSGVVFLYAISGFHLLHVLAGIALLVYLTSGAYHRSKDMVGSLLYFSDQYQQTKLELLNIYWHFVDVMWLSLFFMFLFTL